MRHTHRFIAAALVGGALIAGSAGAGTVTEDDVRRAVEAFVRGELQDRLDEGVRVEVLTRWQNAIEVDAGDELSVEVGRLTDRPLRGPTVLRMVISAGGQACRELGVTADVRYYRPVLVASRGLRRGELLAADMVEVAERDVTRLDGQFFTDPQQLEGMRLRRSLRVAQAVTSDHAEPLPVVERGGALRLVVQTRQLQLVTLGTAMEDGSVGARIRVRNDDSGKVIYGEVIDAGTVRIDL